jgi:hypothetical protein
MTGEIDMTEKPNVDSAIALAMWNAGKTLRQIGSHFKTSPWAARWAIECAVHAGLGKARRGSPKLESPEPPMCAAWHVAERD